MGHQLIERASAIDMMELASATTPAAGQIGAVLVLEPGAVDLETVRSGIDERIRGVPTASAAWRCSPTWSTALPPPPHPSSRARPPAPPPC